MLIMATGFGSSTDVLFMHAFNLLPVYCRLLQMCYLSEHFGTLLRVFFDMYRDTLNFMVELCLTPYRAKFNSCKQMFCWADANYIYI